jgi:dTDP-glucose pyrophosphorylase
MWGVIPAAGRGSRIQPLAFSKELLPVGGRLDHGRERPRAVSEYLIDRMIRGGADKICFVIGPTKTDVMQYYGESYEGADFVYVLQRAPSGLCDAIFRAVPLIADNEQVIVGLPDTIWFPEDGVARLPDGHLSFLLFPVERPEFFDAVVLDPFDRVTEIQVKHAQPASRWIWGAFKMPGNVFHDLHRLWLARDRVDEYFGTLVNAWIADGGVASGVKAGHAYVDVGTLNGYREALRILESGDIGAEPSASAERATR